MAARLLLTAWLLGALALPAEAAENTDKPPAHVDRYGDPLPAGALARIGTKRFRLADPFGVMALSNDGEMLAVGEGKTVRLVDAATGRETAPIPLIRCTATALAFSGDGRLLACVEEHPGHPGAVHILRLPEGRQILRINVPGRLTSRSCAFSRDGKTLAAAFEGYDRKRKSMSVVYAWGVATGKELGRFEIAGYILGQVVLSPDGKVGARRGRLWDVTTGKVLPALKVAARWGSALAFSPDGKRLATMDDDCVVRLWDMATGKETRELKPASLGKRRTENYERAEWVGFSPDGTRVGACGTEGTSWIWDVATGRQQAFYQGPLCDGCRLVFPPSGPALACGLDGRAVRIWDVPSGKERTSAGGHHAAPLALAFTPDGRVLCSVDEVGEVLRHEVPSALQTEGFRLPAAATKSLAISQSFPKTPFVALSPDTRLLARAEDLRGVTMYDAVTGARIRNIRGAGGSEAMLAFSADGRVLGVGWLDGWTNQNEAVVRLWEPTTGRELTFKHTASDVVALAPSAAGCTAAAFVSPKQAGLLLPPYELVLWRGAETKVFGGRARDGEGPVSAAFSPDGRLLAWGDSEDQVRIWDVIRGKGIRHLQSDGPRPDASWPAAPLLFSPDGRTLAVGSGPDERGPEGAVRVVLWDVATGRVRRRFDSPTEPIRSLAFSPDGRLLATGTGRTTLLLWDLTGGAGQPAPPSPRDFERLWEVLAGPDAARAFDAIWAFAAAPDRAVPFLRARLRPAPDVQPGRLKRLVADLDAASFSVRDQSTEELERLGEQAEPALRQALAGKPSLEFRRRVESLLEKLSAVPSPDRLREMRAIEVLERIATPDARAVLADLAKGAPAARLTREAKAALERLGTRPTARR